MEGVLIALSPSIFFVAVSSVIRGYFNGMYNMKATSNSQMIEQFFKSLFTIVIVFILYLMVPAIGKIENIFNLSEENITSVMAAGANLASTIATAVGFVYLYLYYSKRKKEIWHDIRTEPKKYSVGTKRKLVKTILLLAIPMSLTALISAINKNIDTLTVIKGLKTVLSIRVPPSMIVTEATKLYGILSGKVDMLIGLPLSLNIAFATALVPAISERIVLKDVEGATKKIIFSLKISALIAFPCSIGLCILAEPILNLLFSNSNSIEAILLLQLSSFTIIFSVLDQTVNGALQGIGKLFVPSITLAIGAVAKLMLNLILIPRIGINGAAIGTIAFHAIALIIGILSLNKSIKLNLKRDKFILKIIFATLIMTIAIITVHRKIQLNSKLSTIVTIAIGGIIYLISIIVLKLFNKEECKNIPFINKFI